MEEEIRLIQQLIDIDLYWYRVNRVKFVILSIGLIWLHFPPNLEEMRFASQVENQPPHFPPPSTVHPDIRLTKEFCYMRRN